MTSSSGASARRPATGSGELRPHCAALDRDDTASELGESRRPRRPCRRPTSRRRRCCARRARRVEASAPRVRPDPCTKPRPILPVPRWRSIDGDLREVATRDRRSPSRRRPPAPRSSDSVTTWSSTSPIARARPPCQGIRKSAAETGLIRTECLTHSGTSGRSISPTVRPFFSTTSGRNSTRSGRTSRSAW